MEYCGLKRLVNSIVKMSKFESMHPYQNPLPFEVYRSELKGGKQESRHIKTNEQK
jgi:hypothetical protein